MIFGWFRARPNPGELLRLYRQKMAAEHAATPPDDTVQLGTHAERLLRDPVLLLAFDRVAEKLTNTWRASAAADDAGRERVYMQLKALDRVKSELQSFLDNKKMVEAEMKREEQRAA